METNKRGKGLLVVTIGVLLLCPDALLIRLVEMETWSLVFWRSLLAGATIAAVLLWHHRRQKIRLIFRLDRIAVLVGLSFCLGSIGFIGAMQNAPAANVLIIIALAPMFAALFDRLLFKQRLARRTWLAIGCCLLGVVVLVGDELQGGLSLGNLIALGTAVIIGFEFSLMGRTPPEQLWPALCLGYLIALIIAALLSPSLSLSAADNGNLIALLLMGLLVAPVSFMLVSLGPRYLPAPEVAMFLLLETVLGPLLVWWLLGEDPGRYALLGGAIVIAALAWHSAIDLLIERRARSAQA